MKIKSKFTNSKGTQYTIQIDKHDTWSTDIALAPIILANLLSFRENMIGVPASFIDNRPLYGGDQYELEFESEEEMDKKFDELVSNQWKEIVDKMIWAFFQLTYDYEALYYYGTYNWETIPDSYIDPTTNQEISVKRIQDKDPTSHWVDLVGLEEHRRRIQEGIDLFSKYYSNIWV